MSDFWKLLKQYFSEQDEPTEDGGAGSGNFGHGGRPGEVGGSSSGAKSFRARKSPESLIRSDSYINSFDYRFATKQSRSARERRDEAWNQYKNSNGSDKDATLKEFRKLDKLAERYDNEVDAIRKKAAYEQLNAWKHTPPKKTDRTRFEGFTTETTGTPWGDEQLKNPGNYIATMSPEEYLKRCAYDIFEESTLENQVRCGDVESIDKYAEMMENGEKFDLPYLDYRTHNQEGRHRAMAAMKAGILRMPVLVVGYNQSQAEAYRNKRLDDLNPDKSSEPDIPDDVFLLEDSDINPLEMDEEVWRTVTEGNNKGKHYKIETETGEIKGGLGGKLNGVKVGQKSAAKPEASTTTAKFSEPKQAETKVPESDPFDLYSLVMGMANETPEQTAERLAKEKAEAEAESQRAQKLNFGKTETEYPEALRFTSEEQKKAEGLEKYFKNGEDEPGAIYPSNAVRYAANGEYSPEDVDEQAAKLQATLEKAQAKVAEFKANGYQGKGNTAAEWKAIQQEMAGMTPEEKAEFLASIKVGENGIQYWQKLAKKAREDLADLEFAKKLAQRRAYNGNAESEGVESQVPVLSEWMGKLEAEKSEVLSGDKADQARFLFENEFLSYDDAVDCMRQGGAAEKIEQYFDIMAANGDPKPTKATSGDNGTMSYRDVMSQYGGYDEYRSSVIKQNTGWDDAKVSDHLKNMGVWFGGSWDKADTAKLDEYVNTAPAFDGPIYRGLHFSESEYADFMANVTPGSKIGMRGMNSSWTDDQETATLWARNGERSVVLICDKNRTSTPVNALSGKGENEILAHSKASWTVLRVDEGDTRTEIHVVERGQYDE